MRRSGTVSMWAKPAARMPRAWAVRNCFQAGPLPRDRSRCRAGSAAPWRLRSGGRAWQAHPVPGGAPPRVARRGADDELADRGCRGRPPGTPPAGVVPFAGDQPPVPGQQRRRGHREHLALPAPGNQPGERGEPQPVTRLVADPAGLAAQHRVLMTEDQQSGIPGHPASAQHHQAGEQAAHDQVDAREDHSGMISAWKTPPARPDRVIEPNRITVSIAYRTGLKQRTSPSPHASACVELPPGFEFGAAEVVSRPLVAYTSPLPFVARSVAWLAGTSSEATRRTRSAASTH